VDLLAPGVDILEHGARWCYDYYPEWHLHGCPPCGWGSGAAAWPRIPPFPPAEVRARLLDTVDPLTSAQGWVASGGRLNAFNALSAGCRPRRAISPAAIWHDLNGDGVWDSGEAGLAGWTVYLDANQNGDPGPCSEQSHH
jgi:hypothetical protein